MKVLSTQIPTHFESCPAISSIFVFLGILFPKSKHHCVEAKIFSQETAEILNLPSSKMAFAAPSSSQSLVSFDFEVHGKVQGVFFRKHTVAKGKELRLRGWCQNTNRGTVIGTAEGPAQNISKMKLWLRTEGSPKSKITNAVFQNEKQISAFTFPAFEVRK